MSHKTCQHCRQEKPYSEFHKNSRKADGYHYYCKLCKAAAAKKYRSSEKGKATTKAWDAANIEKRREYDRNREVTPPRKAARIKWARNNPEYSAADRAKRRALERELPEFDRWVLWEARKLAVLREKMTGVPWHVDHVVPVTKGGTSRYQNIQVVPASWNIKKSNRHTNRFFAA